MPKIKVFVQGANMVPSPVVGVGRVCSVTLNPVDEKEAEKGGLAPQTSITVTVVDPARFPLGSEHTIEI